MSDLSRTEQLLRNALGEDIYEVTPQSRVEVLLQQLNEYIEVMGGGSVDPEVITAWLAENIHDGAVVDSSLTVEGAAADSKKTGTEISQIKEDLSDMNTATSADVGKALKVKTVTDGKVTEWEFGSAGGGGGGGGQDGFSPIVTVTNITGGHRVSITDATGTKTFDVMDGTNGADGTTFTPSVSSAGVISWTNDGNKQNPSSVDLVAAIPTATTQTAGKMSATDKGRLDTLYADYSSALTALGVI